VGAFHDGARSEARVAATFPATELFKESGIITAAVGGLRMSPHVYNTADHVDRAITSVGRLQALFG
jgi:selenocysteine lyase/cysteine desulfurase